MPTTDFNPPENPAAAVLTRLRSLRNLALDMHDAAVDALTDYQSFTVADWQATPTEIVKEMFERSARLHAARLQALFGMVEVIIDQVDFGRADDFAGSEDD